MASLPPQQCCAEGVQHEGAPRGSIIDVADIQAYITGDRRAKKAIVFLTDVRGHVLSNSQLLADKFAEHGYVVLVPDLFNGDPMPPNDSSKLQEWLPRHGLAVTEPSVLKAIDWVHTQLRPEFLGAVGYCFGAKYVIRALGDPKLGVSAGAVAHPSFVTIEEVAAIKKPLVITAAETDGIFTPELRHETETKLKEIGATYFITEISGVSHGFAVRGDPKVPWQTVAREKAFSDMVWWFSLFNKSS